MITTSLRSSFLVAIASAGLFALGCGASTPHAEHAGEHKHGEPGHEHSDKHEPGEKHEHPKLAGAMDEFHEALAPLWHADKSPERTKKTCDAVPTFEARGGAVDKDAPADAARAPAYHTAAQGLLTAVAELKAECVKPERPDFEAKFKGVHEAFHKVMESTH